MTRVTASRSNSPDEALAGNHFRQSMTSGDSDDEAEGDRSAAGSGVTRAAGE